MGSRPKPGRRTLDLNVATRQPGHISGDGHHVRSRCPDTPSVGDHGARPKEASLRKQAACFSGGCATVPVGRVDYETGDGPACKAELVKGIAPRPRLPERQGGGAAGTCLEKIGPHVNALSLREFKPDLEKTN